MLNHAKTMQAPNMHYLEAIAYETKNYHRANELGKEDRQQGPQHYLQVRAVGVDTTRRRNSELQLVGGYPKLELQRCISHTSKI